MYIGRFLVLGKTLNGKPFVTYRVSSRSFPNRIAKIMNDETVAILPKNLEEMFKNPYITYNCVKIVGNIAVVTNGSHTDIIADKIRIGLPIRDALSYSLLTMDYEKDDFNTPRIAAVLTDNEAYMGYVSDNDIRIKKVELEEGYAYYLSTYEACKITEHQKIEVSKNTPEDLCKFIMEYKIYKNAVFVW
jgi:IMP cyclohydrolase